MNLSEEQIKSIVIKSIQRYLNNGRFDSNYIEINFTDAIIVATEEFKEVMKQPSNISSITEGQRSTSFKNGGIGMLGDNVKSLLPNPYVKVF